MVPTSLNVMGTSEGLVNLAIWNFLHDGSANPQHIVHSLHEAFCESARTIDNGEYKEVTGESLET